MWAKVLSARDAAAARRAAFGAAGAKLAFGLATTAIALAGLSLGVGGPPAELFPRAVFALAGPALAPLLLVALVATMQSSADSVLLSAAAATAHDLVPGAGVRFARAAVVVYGAAGLAVALVLQRPRRDVPARLHALRVGPHPPDARGLRAPASACDRRFAGAAMLLGGAAAMLERFAHVAGVDPVLAGTGVNALVLACGVRRSSRPAP